MDTQKNTNISLEHIQANRQLVDELSVHKLISPEAREYALNILYPAKNWGLWASRLLLVLGVSLVLAGIIYFFAFNWNEITPAMKLGSVQLAILVCIAAAYFQKLEQLPGKVLLLGASVLVGVFLAVFGQVYQTGADAYNLFIMWAALILPWVIITEFAALWVVWLVIANLALNLYWSQAAQPERDMEFMIISYLAIFNSLFLTLREYFVSKQTKWLEGNWTRVILVVPILILAMIAGITYVVDSGHSNQAINISALISVIILVVFYVIYRFKLPDMWSLSATILSGCIIVEVAILRIVTDNFSHTNSILFLFMGCITLGIFTLAVIKLRSIGKEMGVKHV
ncbi:MAG: DUF2157 domain-containing protein [Rickettsiales bacterium]